MKRILVFLLFICLFACNKENLIKESTYLGYLIDKDNNLVPLLNTEVYMTTVRPNKKEKMTIEAQELLFKYHKLLDGYHEYEDIINIKYINDHFNQGPIKIDKELFDCLKDAIKYSKLTKGYFNFTVGKLSDLYSDKFLPFDSINNDPKEDDIKEALESIIPYQELDKYIILDEANSTIELLPYNDKQYIINLGAMSKGYALNKISLSIDSSYLITAGSSSIRTYINNNEKINWNIGSKQNGDNEIMYVMSLGSEGISTSGDSENYYLLEDGTRRHHILNPYSGYPENYYRMLTLISEDAGIMDALSTALFNIEDRNQIKEIINDIEKEYNQKIKYCFVKEINKDKYELIVNEEFKQIMDESQLSNKIERVVVE